MTIELKEVKSPTQMKQFFKIFNYWHKQGKIGSVPFFILYRARDNGELFILKDKREPLGISWIIPRKRPLEFAQLKTLAVAPDHLGKGYGDRLLNETIKKAKSRGHQIMTTGVLTDNKVAKKLYKKHKFKPITRIKSPKGIITDELILGL